MDREKGHILFPKGSQSESFNSNISDSDFLHKTKHNMTSIITGLKKGDLQRKIQRAQLVEPEKKVKMVQKRQSTHLVATTGGQEGQFVHSVNICALKRDGKTVKVINIKRKLRLTTRRYSAIISLESSEDISWRGCEIS